MTDRTSFEAMSELIIDSAENMLNKSIRNVPEAPQRVCNYKYLIINSSFGSIYTKGLHITLN